MRVPSFPISAAEETGEWRLGQREMFLRLQLKAA